MNKRMLAVAIVVIASSTAQARSIMLCTQVAGIAQHKTTGECRGFTNGCQLDFLRTKGFQVAGPDACKNEQEFGATKVMTATAEASSVVPAPSVSTMVCEGKANVLKNNGHNIRLTVITGRALATGGAMIEVTQTAPHARFAPAAVLASIKTVSSPGVSRKDGVYYTNQADGFDMFIPEFQPSNTSRIGAIVKLGGTTFSTQCRTLIY